MPSKTGKKHIQAKNRSRNRRATPAKVNALRSSTNRPAINQQASNRSEINKRASDWPTPPSPPQNGYMIWGRHAVFAALANNDRRVAQIYAASDDFEAELQSHLRPLPPERRNTLPPIQRIDRQRLDALAGPHDKAVHQGMLAAVWPLEGMNLEDCIAGLDGRSVRLLLLDQLSDPRNVGAIMRSALALGAQAIITTHRNAPEESGALARAAAGALERVPMIRVVNLARAIERLQEDGIEIAGLAADGDSDVGSLREIERLGIVMGAEGTGLRHLTRRHCDRLVRINISEESESLNVSIAAAIALYAARLD